MRVRILPPNEWNKILPLYQMSNAELPDPKVAVIVVAESDDGKEILGMRCLRPIVWAGSMWVDSYHRKQGVATAIQKEVERIVPKLGLGNEYFMFPSNLDATTCCRTWGLKHLYKYSIWRGSGKE